MSLAIAAGLGLGGAESYPGVFGPFGGFADDAEVENGCVPLSERPGIGFEGQAAIYAIMRFDVLAEKCLGHEFPSQMLIGFGAIGAEPHTQALERRVKSGLAERIPGPLKDIDPLFIVFGEGEFIRDLKVKLCRLTVGAGADVGMGPGWRLDVFRRLRLNADNTVCL